MRRRLFSLVAILLVAVTMGSVSTALRTASVIASAVDLSALKLELTTDPVSLGYLPHTAENDALNADIINNKDGTKSRTVNRDMIDASDFVGATTFDAYDGLTAAEEAFYNMQTNRDSVSVTADTLEHWAGIGGTSLWAVADRAVMEPRVAALMQFQGSRAQEIADTLGTSFVTPSDVANARSQ